MRLKNLFMMAFLFIAVHATAQQMPQLPVDKDVRIGKLDNGLTYYIRYNNWPENRAEFYIAQKVGSLQENDDQRGLAHFLEHMCFNGTQSFPGNGVMRYCESIGVQFGRDLNAYTSFDRTVYNISNVPTARTGAQDSCLLILHDWADGLLLEPEEIDKERGVIHLPISASIWTLDWISGFSPTRPACRRITISVCSKGKREKRPMSISQNAGWSGRSWPSSPPTSRSKTSQKR